MTNESLKKYMTSLSPEVREKARKCQTKEELFALIEESGEELPEPLLGQVAGGFAAEFNMDEFLKLLDEIG